jgi:subtilisin family serine protease
LVFRFTALGSIDLDAIGVFSDALAAQLNGGIFDWFGNDSAQINEAVVAAHSWSAQTGWGTVDALAAINALTNQNLSDVAAGSTPWWFGESNINDAWSYGYTGKDITIAVLDTGINLNNWEITANLLRNDSRHFYVDSTTGQVVSDTNISDDNGHGTFVASEIVAANNGYKLTGGSYDSSLMVLKVLPASGSGPAAPIIEAIYYAVDHGANIINMSLGATYGYQPYVAALQYASDHNVLVVMSSGNDDSEVPHYPASYAQDFDNCLAVGGIACDSSGVLSQYTDANSAGLGVPYGYVNAGGVDVYGYYTDTDATRIYKGTGTSMAAPIVAAAAALAWSADPSATAAEVARVLYQTSHTVI